MRLAGTANDKGFRLVRHREIGSSNDEALACGQAGDPGRLWIVAETQTGGRGRMGRFWSSPPGNLYASLLLIDPAPQKRMAELGFVVGVALGRALRKIVHGDNRLALKWPNDVLYDGAKLAGILLEGSSAPDGRFMCVAGVGVNCSTHPEVALYNTTDLGDVLGAPVAPEIVFENLSGEIAHWLEVWSGGAGFDEIRVEWLSLAAGINERVRVASPRGFVEGVFRTIDLTGRLVLEEAGATVAIEAGDVFLLAPLTAPLTASALGRA